MDRQEEILAAWLNTALEGIAEAPEHLGADVLMSIIFYLDLYGNMEQSNKTQFQTWDISNILTFFVSWSIQMGEYYNKIIAWEKNKPKREPIKIVQLNPNINCVDLPFCHCFL